jgi:hypothetical protein
MFKGGRTLRSREENPDCYSALRSINRHLSSNWL